MKKILSFVLTLTLILSMSTVALVASAAETAFSLTASKTTLKVGDTVEVYFNLDSIDTSVLSLANYIFYDNTALEFQSVTQANIATHEWTNTNEHTDEGEYYICIQFSPSDGETGLYELPSEKFVTVTFKALKDGETTVYYNENFEAYDADWNTLEMPAGSVKLTVGDPDPDPDPIPAGTSFSLTANKTTLEVGDTVEVYFNLDSIDTSGVLSLANYIFYDNTALEFQSVTQANIATHEWTNTNEHTDEGEYYICIQFSPSDGETGLYELPSEKFVTVTFKALKSGETTVYYNENFEAYDADWNTLEMPAGSVKLTATGSEPDPTPVTYEVTFKDVDGSVLATVETDTDGKIDTTKIPEFPVSAEYVYAWSCGEIPATFTDDTVITMVKSDRTYTITAVNCTADKSSATYKSALIVTADAEMDGKSFSCWKKNGVVVSYATTYKLIVYSDVTIEAVYGDDAATASAFIDTPYYTAYTTGKIKMVSSLQVVLPKDITVESFEIKKLASNTAVDAATVLSTGATVNAGSLKFNAQGRLDYSLVASVDSTKVTYIAFTATLSDGSTITSNVVAVSAQYART